MPKEKIATPESVGNQFGYLCPKCGEGDDLSIVATVVSALCPDGTDIAGDREWDGDSGAYCECGWAGNVRDFKQAPNFEADWNPALDLPKSRLLES
jgi:hypothetical protein